MKIYKYRFFNKENDQNTYERTKNIINSKQFWFGDWKDMNDPMEGFFKYYIDEHPSSEIRALKLSKDTYGICCLSKEYNNILLWSHYADNHKGICIEIEIDDNLCQKQNITFEEIKYKSNIPKLVDSSKQKDKAKWLLSRKTILWNYEKEIRAFCRGSNTSHKIGKITKIFIGLRCPDIAREELKQLCDKQKIIYKEVEIDFDNNIIIEKI